jgi:hypothetical protein
VTRAIQEREFRLGTAEFGEAFETYIMHELTCYRDYGLKLICLFLSSPSPVVAADHHSDEGGLFPVFSKPVSHPARSVLPVLESLNFLRQEVLSII